MLLIINHIVKYCEKKAMKGPVKIFWSTNISFEVLNNLKSRNFHAPTFSTYDFSPLHTTLPHNLIKAKLVDSVERILKAKALSIFHVMIDMLSSPLMQSEFIIYGVLRKGVKLSPFS